MKATFLFATILFLLTSGSPSSAQPDTAGILVPETKFIPAEKTIYYKLGEKTLPIRVSEYGNSKDIVCINLHDNEMTSVFAGRTVLETRGGILIRLENNNQRVIRFRLRGVVYAFDPNRIFSRTGIEQSLKENGRVSEEAIEEIARFAARLLEILPEKIKCLVALHNNTEGAYSILSYMSGGDRVSDARVARRNEEQDPDDIAFTTDEILYQKMADQGYNTIWQDNDRAKKDGSLSVYCGEKYIRYINIETQHGRTAQYIEMLEKLLEIVTSPRFYNMDIP